MKHVVMFSGGIGSWACAKRVVERHGAENTLLLFADTKIEDPDLYRFLHEAAANVGAHLEIIAEGRTPFEVFRDERFLGNHRFDPCSKILKREFMDRWMREHFTPENCRVYVGIDWSESHRIVRLAERKKPWVYSAPMCDAPYLTKRQVLEWAKGEGLTPPRLYSLGFPHNNCGGACVKAGKTQWAMTLEKLPEVYAKWEAHENEMRAYLGRDDIHILKDETLTEYRERLQEGFKPPQFDFGGCGCAIDDSPPPTKGAGNG